MCNTYPPVPRQDLSLGQLLQAGSDKASVKDAALQLMSCALFCVVFGCCCLGCGRVRKVRANSHWRGGWVLLDLSLEVDVRVTPVVATGLRASGLTIGPGVAYKGLGAVVRFWVSALVV